MAKQGMKRPEIRENPHEPTVPEIQGKAKSSNKKTTPAKGD